MTFLSCSGRQASAEPVSGSVVRLPPPLARLGAGLFSPELTVHSCGSWRLRGFWGGEMTDDDGYGEGFEDEDDRPARTLWNWRLLLPPRDERKRAALDRLMSMERMLDHLYAQRGVSDTEIVQDRGLEGHEFVGIPDHETISISRTSAASSRPWAATSNYAPYSPTRPSLSSLNQVPNTSTTAQASPPVTSTATWGWTMPISPRRSHRRSRYGTAI